MNPIIFLDHDGVICLSTEWGSRFKKQKKWGGRKMSMSNGEVPLEYRFDNFNKKAVKVLNEILEETGAEIVVSSDWKLHCNLEEMGEYYESQGIIKKPISFTPHINDCNNHDNTFKWIRDLDLEQSRCLEIKQYLQDNPSVNRWVSIDDMDLSVRNILPEWGLSNFVKTNPDGIGLCEDGIKDKVLSFLTKKDTYSYKENEICPIHLNLFNNEGLCLNCLNENHR